MNYEQHQPRVSVVIPVFNGGRDLEQCLRAVEASAYPAFECILVDDASTDGMAVAAAERHGARLLRLDRQGGPAMARNRGVAQARGDIVFFTDADVQLHPDALGRAVQALQSDPGVSAVFGSYDDQPAHPSFVSQYRNLLHHWTHQTGQEEASTFWSGCGAIRRDVFIDMGGFARAYGRPSIEDIELGTRLRDAGHRIRLLKDMLGTHMKRWTFWHMIRTDIVYRGVPWMLLLLRRRRMTSDLNLNYRSRVATVLAGMLGLSFPALALSGHAGALLPVLALTLTAAAAPWLLGAAGGNGGKALPAASLAALAPLPCYWLAPDPMALIPLGLALAVVATQLAFNRYVARKRGGAFAVRVAPLQLVFFLCCAVSIPLALAEHMLRGRGMQRRAYGRSTGDALD